MLVLFDDRPIAERDKRTDKTNKTRNSAIPRTPIHIGMPVKWIPHSVGAASCERSRTNTHTKRTREKREIRSVATLKNTSATDATSLANARGERRLGESSQFLVSSRRSVLPGVFYS